MPLAELGGEVGGLAEDAGLLLSCGDHGRSDHLEVAGVAPVAAAVGVQAKVHVLARLEAQDPPAGPVVDVVDPRLQSLELLEGRHVQTLELIRLAVCKGRRSRYLLISLVEEIAGA